MRSAEGCGRRSVLERPFSASTTRGCGIPTFACNGAEWSGRLQRRPRPRPVGQRAASRHPQAYDDRRQRRSVSGCQAWRKGEMELAAPARVGSYGQVGDTTGLYPPLMVSTRLPQTAWTDGRRTLGSPAPVAMPASPQHPMGCAQGLHALASHAVTASFTA